MEQFSLEKYLENSSRKVITRDGRLVRIICTDRKARSGNIVGLVGEDESFIYVWQNDGTHSVSGIDVNDLFFADEEEKLDEFETRIYNLINFSDPDNSPSIEKVKEEAEILLDLARNELQPEFDKEMDKMLAETDKVVYQKGREDAMKDLPKWKKCVGSTGPFIDYNSKGESYLYLNDYGIKISELEKLPIEE